MEEWGRLEKGHNLKNLNWKFLKYFKTYGYLVQVDRHRKEVVVFLPKNDVMFIADVSSYVNIEKLKVDRIYEMTFAVYSCKANYNQRKLLIEKLKTPYLQDKSKYRKEYNLTKMKYLEDVLTNTDTLYRFELLNVFDWFYSSVIRNRFEYAVLKSFRAPTKYRWRHILGF